MLIYRVQTTTITHDHMAGLAEDQRRRRVLLAQWRIDLGLGPHAKPRTGDGRRVIGFAADHTTPIPAGWRFDQRRRVLTPDKRTRVGLSAWYDLGQIPTGKTGPHQTDRRWPGQMPYTVMYRRRPASGGSPRWHVESAAAELHGARIYLTWGHLPDEFRQRLNPEVWEEITPTDLHIDQMLRPGGPHPIP